ncbi:hypothetical protein ACFL2A_06500 [Thermodesulfobacteriota bacterium]
MRLKKIRLLFIIACVTLTATLLSAFAFADGPDQKAFKTANSLFLNQQYDEARIAYEKLVKLGYNDATIYYNLSNTYFFIGDNGKGALYLYRAREIDPRSEDIKKSIKALDAIIMGSPVTKDESVNDSAGSLKGFIISFKVMTKNEVAMLALFLYLFFFIWILTRKLFPHGAKRALAATAGTISYLLSIFFIFIFVMTFYYEHYYPQRVALETVELRSSPSKDSGYNNGTLLKEGMLIELNDTYDDWGKVILANGTKTGWVKLDILEGI